MRRFLRPLLAVLAFHAWCCHAAEPKAGQAFRDCDECPEMLVIPAGAFQMGLPAAGRKAHDNAQPAHKVTIARPFAIGRTEVTRRQWRAVMGVNPTGANCDDCPAENVSWNAAQEFARRLSTKTGKQYRLPSEAEWEYACRAGGQHEYCGGDDPASVAWYENNSGGAAQPVGRKQPNAFGLHDMTGNSWEWTEDCWNGNYEGAPTDGSAWTSGACASRVLRGGSWQYKSQFIGAIVRSGSAAGMAGASDGVRVVRNLP